MNHSSGTLHNIRWNELCPSLVLVRALRVSLMVRVLVIAMAGVLLTHWGWSMVDRLFATATPQLSRLDETLTTGMLNSEIRILDSENDGPLLEPPSATPGALDNKDSPILFDSTDLVLWGGPLARAWTWLSEPFVRTTRSAMVRGTAGWKYSAALGLCSLWTIVVWALFGGAIVRIAALHLTRHETPAPLSALKEASQKWVATAGAPLIPLVGSVLIAAPLILAGLMLRSDMLALVIGLIWILIIVWGFLLAVILIGMLVGWPLMWATIGVERTDAFDGVSRCFAYVYQRPLHMVCYVLIAGALGWLGQVAVEYFATVAIAIGEWSLSWGAGGQRLAELMATTENSLTGMAATGAKGIRFWKDALQLLVASYAPAYLWSASVGIYLLLRRQVDSTEMDEISIEEDADGLPPLRDDPSGVPQML